MPAYIWATEYQQDDWEWLLHGSSVSGFVEHVLNPTQIIRPLFHGLYAIAYATSGLDARPLAVALALIWCATAVAAMVMLRLARFPLGIAILAVLITRPLAASADAFYQVSYHGLTLSRLLLVCTCIAFLRGTPHTATWLALLVAGFLVHEQYIVALPVLLVLLVWRDGVSAVHDRWKRPGALRSFSFAFAALAAIRVVIFALGDAGTHSPGLSRVLANLFMLIEGLPPFCSPFLIAAFGLGLSAIAPARIARPLALGAVLYLVGYAPFAAQEAYFASYFGNLSVIGAGLAMAVIVVHAVDSDLVADGRWRKLRAAAVLLLLLAWAATPPRLEPRRAPNFAPQIAAIAESVLDEDLAGRNLKIVFVDAAHDGGSREPAPYFAAIGLEDGRSSFFKLRWPEISFEFERVAPETIVARRPDECELRLAVAPTGTLHTPWKARLMEPFECSPPEEPSHRGEPPGRRG